MSVFLCYYWTVIDGTFPYVIGKLWGGGVTIGKTPRMASKKKSKSKESEGGAAPAPEVDTGEKFTFFFGADSPFSQWHSASFTVGEVEYNCAEQYMMHRKAGKSRVFHQHLPA